jgi:hypothetical protein
MHCTFGISPHSRNYQDSPSVRSNPMELGNISPRFDEDVQSKFSIARVSNFSVGSQQQKIIRDLEKRNFRMRDYFRLIVLSVKLNIPLFMMNEVIRRKDPDDMYNKAKKEGVKWHQYYEWVLHEIEKNKFNFDMIMEGAEESEAVISKRNSIVSRKRDLSKRLRSLDMTE